MDGGTELIGFAYGEDREQGSDRSLGYRLLAPAVPASWTNEVEALARRLQAAPYPDAWPAVDLFCSVLLADGRRVVARARYGLSDHTSVQRRGGLELVGVVAPASLEVKNALAIYRWLAVRRESEDDLSALGGTMRLGDVLSAAPPELPRPEGTASPVPVLPVRLWQDGAFLFAAAAPTDPDHHLALLEMVTTSNWQWLPLVGPDFPLSNYSSRGPLIAWTAHLAGVAVRLDRTPKTPPVRESGLAPRWLAWTLATVIIGLLGANLWYTHRLRDTVATLRTATEPKEEPTTKKPFVAPRETDERRERFARALHRTLIERGERPGKADRETLLDRYEQLLRRNPDLALAADNEEGKLAVAHLATLAGRGDERIDRTIRQALEGKGFSDKLIQAAREHIREQLASEWKER
jgi:hypothetical protein